MLELRQDSYTQLRDRLRWRVAVVLCVLVATLMSVLHGVNLHLGITDNARLSAAVAAGALVSGFALWRLPHRQAGGFFFGMICAVLIIAMAHGRYYGHPMPHWAYIFPPAIIFLLRARPSLIAMVGFGIYAVQMLHGQIVTLDLIRFASGYGVLVCFMFTYALLQERVLFPALQPHDPAILCHILIDLRPAVSDGISAAAASRGLVAWASACGCRYDLCPASVTGVRRFPFLRQPRFAGAGDARVGGASGSLHLPPLPAR